VCSLWLLLLRLCAWLFCCLCVAFQFGDYGCLFYAGLFKLVCWFVILVVFAVALILFGVCVYLV